MTTEAIWAQWTHWHVWDQFEMIWTYPVDGYTYVIMATTILSQVMEFSTQLVLRGSECPPPKYPTSLHHRHKPENLDFGWIYTLMLFYNKFWPYRLNVKVENETTKHFSGLQLSILADPLLPQFPVLSWQWSHLLQSFAASRVHILYWVVATCLGGEIAVEQVYLIKRPVNVERCLVCYATCKCIFLEVCRSTEVFCNTTYYGEDYKKTTF